MSILEYQDIVKAWRKGAQRARLILAHFDVAELKRGSRAPARARRPHGKTTRGTRGVRAA